MRFTHRNVTRPFSVPLGPWIIPGIGAILCILLLINTTKGTAIRYAIWMGLGQFVYFGYSYRKSRVGRQMRAGSVGSVAELVPGPPDIPLDPIDQPKDLQGPRLETVVEAVEEVDE